MFVKVIKDFKGSPDGVFCQGYVEGQYLDLEGDLLDVALKEKWVKKTKMGEPDLLPAQTDPGDGGIPTPPGGEQ